MFVATKTLFAGVAFAFTAVVNGGAFAADTVHVRSGSEVRLGGGWNCDDPNRLPQVTVIKQPTHGTAEVRTLASGAPCNGMPMVAVFYKADAGFKGQDEVFYQIAQPGSGRRVNHRSTRKAIIVR